MVSVKQKLQVYIYIYKLEVFGGGPGFNPA